MNESYGQYFKQWASGITNEILFWDKLVKSEGSCGGDAKVFKYRIDPNCPFQLMDDLEEENGKIIDIGSGPYSRIGFCVGTKKLDITLVDPLAAVYR